MRRSFQVITAFLLLCVLSMTFTSNVVLARPSIESSAKPAQCFPGNTSWTWSNQTAFLQAWIGPRENDDQSGIHYNLHIQPFCGSNDYYNYHITYNGTVDGDHVWQVYESVNKKTEIYNGYTSDEGEAANTAASAFAGDVGKVVSKSVSENLSESLLNILPQVFLNLVGGTHLLK